MTRAPGTTTTTESFRVSTPPVKVTPAVVVAAALPSPAVRAASQVAGNAAAAVHASVAFRQLPIAQQQAIDRDLRTIRDGLARGGDQTSAGVARAMETPDDFRQHLMQGRGSDQPTAPATGNGASASAGAGGSSATSDPATGPTSKTRPATETLASRVGALSDEVDFPGFVAGLVHGTFDAMVDASIRQMEAFADLISSVAKTVEEFTRDNVTRGQVIDWLVDKYPRDLVREVPLTDGGGPARLRAREVPAEGEDAPSPDWLADFGLAGEALTDDVIENSLIPAASRRVGENRMQTLATMVLLGMNRVVVKDGSISAKVRFRAAANDTAAVQYANSSDPGRQTWAERGSAVYAPPSTMISTINANVQTDTDLKAELYGEVRINFVSETLPLDRFADSAKITLLQGNARVPARSVAAVTPPSTSGASAPAFLPASTSAPSTTAPTGEKP